MNLNNKWAYGIGIALLAIGGALVALFDGDESTKLDIGDTATKVQQSIEVLTTTDDVAETPVVTP